MPARALIGRVALLIAAFAFAFGIAEIGVRLVLAMSGGDCEEPRAGPDGPILVTLDDFRRPNARGTMVCNVSYRTNSAGFRGPEISEAKPPGVFRIAVAGDSYTMGSGVAEDETYAYRLQELLNDEAPDSTRYQTLNLGIAGLPIRQVIDRIEEIGLKFDPDLLVYGWTLNDIETPHYERLVPWADRLAAIAKNRSASRSLSTSHSKLLTWLRWRWSRRSQTDDDPTSYQAELIHNYFDNERAWAEFTSELDRLAAIQRREGLCAVVFLNPHLIALDDDHPFTQVYEKVENATRERDLFAVPSFEAFRGRSVRSLWLSPGNPHPNRKGHALLAEALFAGLKQLPERCWNSTARDRSHG